MFEEHFTCWNYWWVNHVRTWNLFNMKIAVNNENIERVPRTKILGQKSAALSYQEKPCPSTCLIEIILEWYPSSFVTRIFKARLRRVQKAAASFDNGKYATTSDILKLNWLPVTVQREWLILKSTHKSLFSSDWPNYLRLETYENNRNLRSSSFKDQWSPICFKMKLLIYSITFPFP